MAEVAIGGQTFSVSLDRAASIKRDIARCAKEEISCILTFADERGRESWTVWTPGTPIVINDWDEPR